ncbi:MAG TPA: hypothetical protein ENI27_05915 [bacterium]|nr:hypothetical protein [bacterium]
MNFLEYGAGPKYSDPLNSWLKYSMLGSEIQKATGITTPLGLNSGNAWPLVLQEKFLKRPKTGRDDDEVLALLMISITEEGLLNSWAH